MSEQQQRVAASEAAKRIPIKPGIFVVSEIGAGKGWIEALHILIGVYRRRHKTDISVKKGEDNA